MLHLVVTAVAPPLNASPLDCHNYLVVYAKNGFDCYKDTL
jgi:hypothetical protein